MHVTMLKRDYYRFDAANQRLIGERCGDIYRLGDSVKVRVIRVDLDDRKIDLEMLEKTAGATKRSKKELKKGSKKS